MAFVPWHDHRELIYAAYVVWWWDRTPAKLQAVDVAISNAINTPYVKKKNGMTIEVDELGKAYSAMDQADMGSILIEVGSVANRPDLVNLGYSCLLVLLTLEKDGGLRRRKDGVSWFHAMTSRDNKSPGGTLNKHLVAVRELLECSKTLRTLGQFGRANDLYKAGMEGLLQLVSDPYPNLGDFIVRYKGDLYPRSWLYYAVSFSKKTGYHLDNGYKNATYHSFVLYLIYLIKDILGNDFPTAKFQNFKIDNKKVIRFIFDTYMLKKAEGVHSNGACKKGDFSGFSQNNGRLLTLEEEDYFRNTY